MLARVSCPHHAPAGSPCARCLLEGVGTVDTIAGLQLAEELGHGGMGTVYRARHLKLGRDVAVKFLKPEVAANAEARERFEREAQSLALIDHPHVVRVYDFGTEDGETYLVMELVHGGAVSQRLPLTPKEAIRVTMQVCEALQAAHDKGIIHRDIKPQNVLLDERGEVKVTDFGIARLTAPQTPSLTQSNVALGSAGYMAPETLRGKAPTSAVDVFATGALLRELLTGQPPVGAVSGLAMGLDTVVRRAMAEDPAQRFPSMAAMRDALARYLAAPDTSGAMPVHEALWIRAVALLQVAAFAGMLFALLMCFTPRTLAADEVAPLTTLSSKVLPDGRVLTRARFETVPVLISIAVLACALAATALLRRHWHTEGLDTPQPDAPIDESKRVLQWGIACTVVYVVRQIAMANGWLGPPASAYVPVFGGGMLLVVAYFAAHCLLEAQRRGRSLWQEPQFFFGVLLGLIPPVVDGVRQISDRL